MHYTIECIIFFLTEISSNTSNEKGIRRKTRVKICVTSRSFD